VATRGWDGQLWYWQPVVSPVYPAAFTTVGFPPTGNANDPLMYGINIPALNHPAPGLIFGLIVLDIIVIWPDYLPNPQAAQCARSSMGKYSCRCTRLLRYS
jgi:hypothetical protein